MTDLRDFLMWFDGFSENIKKQPSAAQWARVKERFEMMRKATVAADPIGMRLMPAPVATTPQVGPVAMPAGPAAPAPLDPNIAKHLAEIKKRGAASVGGGGTAMSAGP